MVRQYYAVTIIIIQLAAKGPAYRLASGLLWYPFYSTKNKELWTELGQAVTTKIGYEGNSRSVQRVLPKITSLHEVTAAGTPK